MQNRTIVVTGAAGVLGKAVCSLAHARGARVIAIDRETPSSIDATKTIGAIDLTNVAATSEAMAQGADEAGEIYALINVAGGFRWQTLSDGEASVWDLLYELNVKTTLTACKAALPFLRAGVAGRIVNVGALASVKAGAGMGAYATSKAGVAKLTESLAEELKHTSVTVNAVLPSIIDTPANRRDLPDADHSAWVAPHDLAAVILFLASEDAKAVTGALVPVTGRV